LGFPYLCGPAVLGGKVTLPQIHDADISIMGALCLGGVQRPSGDLLHSFITLDIIESLSHRAIEPSGH